MNDYQEFIGSKIRKLKPMGFDAKAAEYGALVGPVGKVVSVDDL